MSQQADWRFCQKCEVMFFDGYADKGVCAVGGGHLAQGYNFNLPYSTPESGSAQTNWRYCSKCHAMFFDGYPIKGVCAGGGGHTAEGYNFTLPHDIAVSANAQAAWHYCQNCHAMFYDGFSAKGECPGHMVPGPRGPVRGGHVAQGFNFVLPYDASAPAPPPDAPQFSLTGPVWVVGLDHQQADTLDTALTTLAGVITTVAGASSPAPPVAAIVATIAGAVKGAGEIIQLMDKIGGNQGVDIQGVLGVAGVIVTPHASGMFGMLVQGAREGVAVATIMDYVLRAASEVPALATGLGLGAAAQVFSKVASGTPLGWALAAAAGAIINLVLPTPDPNEHGGIHADRTSVGDWERFIMAHIPPGNQIAILSWQGLFSAQRGGGADVYANRPKISDWETWNIIDNHDGTVSLQSSNGHYLTATNGGGNGSYCMADRTAIGTWERFYIQNVAGGHIAIKTHDQATYLSVQSGK